MHTTIHLRLLEDWGIFPAGMPLELEDRQETGLCQGQEIHGYPLPDTGAGPPGVLPQALVEKHSPEAGGATEFYGPCLLTGVQNFYREPGRDNEKGKLEHGVVAEQEVRCVHYPDCQQLVFHLPKYAWDAGRLRLLNRVTGAVLEDLPVRDKLSGSTQILLDTLPYPPGFYHLEADWPDGWTHQLSFIKYAEGFRRADVPAPRPAGNLRMVQNDYEHRLFDSDGNEVETGERQIREEAGRILAKAFRRLEFQNYGRTGMVRYVEGARSFEMDYEFGGGDCLVFLSIPGLEQWEGATGTLLAERAEILEFIAQETLRQQAPNCRYKIEAEAILIVRS